ncbi:hypothetical protein AB0D74_49620 [Streptomyces sp. NPDC048278]|uniref:hypothetical protein n=1 Tax=Streptomyces sp. NPDC048278 TaxID=3155809 RepID=UPI0034256F98
MNDDMPESEAVRLFTVPITPELAQEAADALAFFRDLAENALPAADGAPFDESATSVFLRERAQIEALAEPLRGERRKLYSMLIQIATLTKDNAIDHVRALEHDILMDPPPVWSPLTLSRVVMEGVLFSEYLLDPSISLAKRFARVAGVWMTDALHSEKQALALGADQPGASAMKAYVEDCLRKCQASERRNVRDKLIGYSVDGEDAPMDLNITERAARAMPSWLPAPYRLTSGAAHNRPWMLDRARIVAGGAGLAGEAATVMAASMVAIGAVETVVRIFGEFFGLDMSSVLDQMKTAQQGFLYRAIAIAHGQ